ncbi:MAG TPA: biotin-dependent carboxyltransferase family protein [Vicinamibacterales bacterium]|nr:biotin-dependent carboxyltransferase family protein [Vicinamibacterales bacterium]
MRIAVRRAGLLTSIQDGGRWGHQAIGVPTAGPMDAWSHRLANLLAGNAATAAALEITATGPDLEFDAPARVAIAGAEFEGTLDGSPWSSPVVLDVRGGSRLTFGVRRRGFRAYLAVAGSLDVPPVLGSRSTDLRSGIGGLDGRPLRDGDTLVVSTDRTSRRHAVSPPALRLPESGACRLRVIPGPDADPPDAFRVLIEHQFTVSPQSDRMGYRLRGVPVPSDRAPRLSTPVAMGAIQLPPDGNPVLLMAERQTTGGYPIVAVVISADLPLAGQLAPGDRASFSPCTEEAALAALIAREQPLLALEAS